LRLHNENDYNFAEIFTFIRQDPYKVFISGEITHTTKLMFIWINLDISLKNKGLAIMPTLSPRGRIYMRKHAHLRQFEPATARELRAVLSSSYAKRKVNKRFLYSRALHQVELHGADKSETI